MGWGGARSGSVRGQYMGLRIFVRDTPPPRLRPDPTTHPCPTDTNVTVKGFYRSIHAHINNIIGPAIGVDGTTNK
jgi:hypothetical protein